MIRTLTKRYTTTDIAMWLIGASILLLVLYGSFSTLREGTYPAKTWLKLLIDGLALGSVYAVIALGYTLVYGILRMINFAHGEVYMSGPLTAYVLLFNPEVGWSDYLASHPLLSIPLAVIVSVGVSTSVAMVLERLAYRPLRRAPRLVPLITAIGASFFLQYLFRGLFGGGIKSYPEMLKGKWTILGLDILKAQVLVITASVLMLIGLYLFVQRTKIGKAMQAVSEDKDAAALMGIDVNRVIVVTFALGGALAGAAGVLYALWYRQVNFYMGFIPGLKAFTAAVLGGIGNVTGAMLGGLFLGVFEALGPNLFLDGLGIPAPYQLKDVIAFTMLVLILIFRPMGIMGERLAETKA